MGESNERVRREQMKRAASAIQVAFRRRLEIDEVAMHFHEFVTAVLRYVDQREDELREEWSGLSGWVRPGAQAIMSSMLRADASLQALFESCQRRGA